MPEQYWDAAGGKLISDKFGEHVNAMTARLAAEDSRRLTLPQTPEAYAIKLPDDFKAPEGIEVKFNENDPLLAQAKGVMHEIDQGKLSGQAAFSKLLALYAGAQVSSEAQITTARNAEIAKLGTTGPARVDAITTFLKAQLGEADGLRVASRMFLAADVAAMEKLVAKFASQGSGNFSQQHRDVQQAGRVDQATYDKMSYSQKMDYARQFPQAQVNGHAPG